MKKLLIPVVLILIICLGWYLVHQRSTTPTVINNANPNTSGHPDPSNATFEIDGSSITLKNGMAPAGSDGSQETDLTSTIAYGDLNGDGSEDAAFVLVTTNPISGTLNAYVAAYVSGLVSYKTTNAVSIGTQIVPQSISIANDTVTVKYLDRAPSDPLSAEPTVPTTKSLTYSSSDNSLSE